MKETPSGAPPIRIIVETPSGLYIRVVEGATPLATGVRQGRSAEDATESAAARWGLPDFVFQSGLHQRGSGNRELGDVLLVLRNRAAVVQVKSRASPSETISREAAWTQKAVTKAARQASGTVRALRGSPATLTNMRGRQLPIDGANLQWLAAIVIDHAAPPKDHIPFLPIAPELPMVVLLRRDWEFLFDQLRSADAVMAYLLRVSKLDPVALGEEPFRYYELANADERAIMEEATPPTPLPEAVRRLGGQPSSIPVLPKSPAGRDDMQAHLILRMILEDIATLRLVGWDEATRMTILAEIDGLPVGERSELGRYLLTMIEHVGQEEGDAVSWAFRRFFWTQDVPHLLFGACTRYDELTSEAFKGLVQLRHYELGRACGTFAGLTSVGVLLTPRHDDPRPWDTSAVRISGEVDFTSEELGVLHRLWGASEDHAGGLVWQPGRDEPE